MEDLKAQTIGIERRRIWNGFLDVFEEEKPSLRVETP